MYERILVGTDGSATATRAVEAAALLARTHDAELVVAHAYSPRLTPAQQRAWNEAPEDLRWRLSSGSIAEDIVETALSHATRVTGGAVRMRGRCEPGGAIPVLLALIDELDPDAIVVGNRDMPARVRTHRSVSRAMARRASCDVVIADTLGRRQQRRRSAMPTLHPRLA